jgi:magnesium transporter
MSSDWISHGLMDSMIDSFVPIIRKIDKEVEGVDALITNPQKTLEPVPPFNITVQTSSLDFIEPKAEDLEKAEKPSAPSNHSFGLLSSIRGWKSRLGSRLWSSLAKRTGPRHQEKESTVEPPPKHATFQTLLRMTNTRRLVTSLGRLLATKSEVIGQLRKRLQVNVGNVVDWDEGDMAGGQEVGIYLGDVQGMCLQAVCVE